MTPPFLVLAALIAGAPPATGRAALPSSSLAELDAAAAEVERGGDADAFWARVEPPGGCRSSSARPRGVPRGYFRLAVPVR